jgi:hypothetical protein
MRKKFDEYNIDKKQILIFIIIVVVVFSVISVIKKVSYKSYKNEELEADIETKLEIDEDTEGIEIEADSNPTEYTTEEEYTQTTEYESREESEQNPIEYYEDKAEVLANADDEEGMLAALEQLEDKLPESELRRIREFDYTKLVLVHMVNLSSQGMDAKDIRDYIDSKLYNTGNNCRLLEFWDYYDNMYYKSIGETRMKPSKVRNINGYVIENSAYELLDYSDLEVLSEYELYFGLYEIYARYGRIFTDTTVSDHFNGTSWYNPSIIPNNFDESILSDIEKQNINTILEYSRSMGYRS